MDSFIYILFVLLAGAIISGLYQLIHIPKPLKPYNELNPFQKAWTKMFRNPYDDMSTEEVLDMNEEFLREFEKHIKNKS